MVMSTLKSKTSKRFIAGALFWMLASIVQAGQPNADDLDKAIKAGDFSGYSASVSAWLNEKTPAKISEAGLNALFEDTGFRNKLAQRQLFAKLGVEPMIAFAAAGDKNQAFLSWLLQNTEAMEQYLLGVTPIGLAAREENTYKLNPAALEIWKNIFYADPDSKAGLRMKLAIATAIAPPGSVNIGAGGAATPADPVVRYTYYKTAQQQGELFPSFDHLTVWEYSTIVCSGASDADLTWAREMVNTFRPDLRAEEMVVNSTSLVWRRNAPPEFYPGGYQHFKNVLAGGGKCGPRSSWSQMVCHAFGIPAIGVGQPAHACVAYKAVNPMTQPQPGSAWKVGYGRGWEFSKLMGLRGPDFLAGVEDRADFAKFSQVERLRWLASALASSERAAAVMGVAHQIQSSTSKVTTDLTASLKPEEAEADPGVTAAGKTETPQPPGANAPNPAAAEPIKATDGVIRVQAAAFVKTGGEISWAGQSPQVLLHDSFTGGKQVYFQQQMKSQWADYLIDVPVAGVYEITMQAAVVNAEQALEVVSDGAVIATVPIPLSYGLWVETRPVELHLNQGMQTLRMRTSEVEHKRGIALKSFAISAKK